MTNIKLIKAKQILFNILATVFFVIGIIGIIFPFLPMSPFLILSFLCLCKGSDSFKNKLKNTKLYKNHLRPLVFFKTMTLRDKVFVVVCFLFIVAVLFVLSQSYFTKLSLLTLALIYCYYFLFIIKTLGKDKIKILLYKSKKNNNLTKKSIIGKFFDE